MKLRLFVFVFLFFACSLLAGRAMAQGCSTVPIAFPPAGGPDTTVEPGTCIANADPDSLTGQGGRLRWDETVAGVSSHELILFDSEDKGVFLWCAGGGGNSSDCAGGVENTVLCLQQDGNMVLYVPKGTILPHCVNNGDGGLAVWASNTDGDNDGQEELTIEENVVFQNVLRTGERALVRNRAGVQFCSLGYVDNDTDN